MKFQWYSQLSAAISSGDKEAFKTIWNSIRAVSAPPWSSVPTPNEILNGHIPFDLTPQVWKRAPAVFLDRGIYMWGAWVGDAARIQYIGVADAQTVESRFRQRYANELRTALRYQKPLRSLPEAFSAKYGSINLQRYLDVGIAVNEKRQTRVPRSERYAKVGLASLWHFVIPVPGAPGSAEGSDPMLRSVETALIHLANAELFDLHRTASALAFPLVNRLGVHPNPRVPDEHGTAYSSWLFDGTWWEEMNRFARSSNAQTA